MQYQRIEYVEYFSEKKILKILHQIGYMFKLSFAIISPIMWVVPPFEHTLIAHTQGLFLCNT